MTLRRARGPKAKTRGAAAEARLKKFAASLPQVREDFPRGGGQTVSRRSWLDAMSAS